MPDKVQIKQNFFMIIDQAFVNAGASSDFFLNSWII